MISTQRPVLLLGVCLLGMLASCYSAKSILLTEHEEFALAQQYMQAKKWDKARLHFQRISDRYPGSALASEAILGKAESFFLAGDYPEAQTEYQLFVEFYPAHEKADLAKFRTGLCQSENIRSVDRDQTPTVEAVKTFQSFLASYPKSAYAQEAAALLVAAQDRLKRHDLYVARFYRRRNVNLSAAMRYRRILESYPLTAEEKLDIQAKLDEVWALFTEARLRYVAQDFERERWFAVTESVGLLRHYRPDQPLADNHHYFYAESLFQLQRRQDARAEFEALQQTHPQSAYTRQAQARISELLTETPSPQIEGELRP